MNKITARFQCSVEIIDDYREGRHEGFRGRLDEVFGMYPHWEAPIQAMLQTFGANPRMHQIGAGGGTSGEPIVGYTVEFLSMLLALIRTVGPYPANRVKITWEADFAPMTRSTNVYAYVEIDAIEARVEEVRPGYMGRRQHSTMLENPANSTVASGVSAPSGPPSVQPAPPPRRFTLRRGPRV